MPLSTSLRRSTIAAALLVALASPAFAQSGINLSWDDCGSFGVASKTFACDTNAGQEVLIGSAISGVDLPKFVAVEASLTVVVDGPALPAWWRLDTGFVSACRKGALSSSPDFTAGPFHCADPWPPGAFGAVAYEILPYPYEGRIRVLAITQNTDPPPTQSLSSTVEYEYFKVGISHAKSTGTGSCGGCSQGATLYLASVQLDQLLGEGDYVLTQPLQRSYVTWQGGSVVPTRPTTWGAVKSLYR